MNLVSRSSEDKEAFSVSRSIVYQDDTKFCVLFFSDKTQIKFE